MCSQKYRSEEYFRKNLENKLGKCWENSRKT